MFHNVSRRGGPDRARPRGAQDFQQGNKILAGIARAWPPGPAGNFSLGPDSSESGEKRAVLAAQARNPRSFSRKKKIQPKSYPTGNQ